MTLSRTKIAVFFLLLLLAGCYWALATTRGNQLLISWIAPNNLSIGSFQGSLWSNLRLENISYKEDQQQITIESLQLQWTPLTLFNDLLHVQQLKATGIHISATAKTTDNKPIDIPKLPFSIQLDQALLEDIQLQQGETVEKIHRIELSAQSHEQLVKLPQVTIGYGSFQLNALGQVSLTTNYPFSLDMQWQGKIDQVGAANGNLKLDGDINLLAIDHQLLKPFNLTTNGRIHLQPETPVLELSGQWQQAQWPLLEKAFISSPNGHFQLKGPLLNTTLEATASLIFPQGQAPDQQVRLQALLTQNGLKQLLVTSDLLDGKTTARGQLLWSPAISWDVSVIAEKINPAIQWSQWPGRMALNTAIQGGINTQGLWLSSQLNKLTGTLHQQPVNASGKLRYDHSGIQLKSMQLTSGPNQLAIDGVLGDTLALKFVLDATDLSLVWPALKGKINTRGQLSGDLKQPQLTALLTASALQLEGHNIRQMDANITWNSQIAKGKLTARDLQSGNWTGRRLEMTIDGSPEKHRFSLLLDSADVKLSSTAQGSWKNAAWQGQINELLIQQPLLGKWNNDKPLKLSVTTKHVNMQPSCLLQQKASLCTAVNWTPKTSKIDAQLVGFPIKPLLHWLPEQVTMSGELNGDLQLQGPLDALAGKAKLELAQGQLLLQTEDNDNLPVDLRDGLLSLLIAPQRNSAQLTLTAGDGVISAQATTGTLSTDGPVPVTGQLHADLPNLKQLSPLLPGLTEMRGQLSADAQVSGNLQQPQIQGFLQLTDGAANIPQLGLTLDAVRVSANNQGSNRILFSGDMKSGNGPLNVQGELLLDAKQGWPLTATLKGDNVQVVKLPEAQVYLSPDVAIGMKNNQLNVRGSVQVAQATIQLKALPKQTIGVSEDEVILGKTEPLSKNSAIAIDAQIKVGLGNNVKFDGFGLKTGLRGSVDLISKDAKNQAQGELSLHEGRYRAYGQDLKIETGRLLFNGPPENPNLDIKATRLSLDQSVTAIFGLSGNLRSPLVKVSSNPLLPEEEALSYLLTGHGFSEQGSDKATMLRQAIAAKGLEKSQQILDSVAAGIGVDEVRINEGSSLEDTSLLLGKYLSPDLYVSYAVGLFNNQGAFITRYRLSKRLRLEVQSGSAQSMDLIYDVEK